MPPKKPVVLIVDDDEGLQRSLCDVLSDDYDAKCVGSTLEARAELRRRSVDALILDWMLRGETSRELLADLGESPVCPPVVVLSGTVEAKRAAERFGVPWVAKPFDTDTLLSTLQIALRDGKRPHRLRP